VAGNFEVVMNGVCVPGQEPATVRANVARLFKTTPDKVAALFSGQLVVIKRGLDEATAVKYQAALRQAGAMAQVREAAPQPSPAASLPTSGDGTMTIAEPGAILATPSEVVAPQFDLSAFSVAEVGAVLAEPEVVPEVTFDLSGIAVAEVGVLLKEPEEVPEPVISLPQVEIAEPGAILAEEEEVVPLVVDVSAFSMAELGAQLSEESAVPEPQIDISKLGIAAPEEH